MQPFLSRLRFFKHLPWLILLTAFFYLIAAWLWKRAFIFGEVQGIYWLLIALDWSVLPLTILCLLGFISVFIVLIVQLIRHQPELHSQALRSGILFIASIMFLVACFPLLITPSIPLDSISIHGRVYHLSLISALIDTNYGLYECDGLGFICQQIYRSGDYSQSSDAKLIYDPSTNTLTVNVDGQGSIYVYNPK
jgi:hypothetical protein